MSVLILKCYEYQMYCDQCGTEEVLHTGDCAEVNGEEIFVHSRDTAIKAALYHRSHGMLLCDKCYSNRKV